MPDYVTVLSNESDSPVTKAFKLLDEEYKSSAIKNSYLHSADQYDISCLTDLANLEQLKGKLIFSNHSTMCFNLYPSP